MTDAASLNINIKETGGKQAADSLDKLSAAAGKAEQAVQRLETEQEKAARLAAFHADQEAKHAARIADSSEKLEKFRDRFANATKGATDAEKAHIATLKESLKEISQIRSLGDGLGVAMRLGPTALGGLAVGVGGVFGAIKGIEAMVRAGMEAEEVMTRLEAVLQATGGASGRTAKQIDDLANKLSDMTTFDDESIKRAATALATFPSISGPLFDRALKASTDLAATMGTDVVQAAQQLGRALEDPERGVTALRRAGIVLSETQREMIKDMAEAGDTMGAQAELLKVIEDRTKGVAEAMRDTLSGSLQVAKNEVGSLAEEMDKLLGFSSFLRLLVDGFNAIATAARLAAAGINSIGGLQPEALPKSPMGGYLRHGLPGLAMGIVRQILEGDRDDEERARKAREAAALGLATEDAATRNLMVAAQETRDANDVNAAVSAIKKLETDSERAAEAVKKLRDAYDVVMRKIGNDETLTANERKLRDFVTSYGGLEAAIKAVTDAIDKPPKAPKVKEDTRDFSHELEKAAEFARNFARELDAGSAEQAKFDDGLAKLKAGMEVANMEMDQQNKLIEAYIYKYHPEEIRKRKELEKAIKDSVAITKERQKAIEDAAVAEVDAWERAKEAMDQYLEPQKQATRDALADAKRAKEEVENFGKAEADLAALAIARKQDALATLQQALAKDQNNERLRAEIGLLEREIGALKDKRASQIDKQALEAARDSAAEMFAEIDNWVDQLEQSMTDALFRSFEDGKSFGESFFSTLRNLAKTTAIRLLIQPVMGAARGMVDNAIGGIMSGGMGGGGFDPMSLLSSGAGMGGFSGLMGGLPFIGGAGPLAGTGTGLAGMLAGAGFPGLGAFAAGMGSPLATISAGMSGGLAAMGGIGGALGAAVPVVGAVLAIAAMAGAFDRGGPKTGGFAQTPGMGLTPFFTETQANRDLQSLVTGTRGDYRTIARTLGIRPGQFDFAVGYDSDPEGDAGNRISAGASLNGQQIIRERIAEGIGDDIEEALAEVAGEALKGALLASDLPDQVKTLIGKMDDSLETFGTTASRLGAIDFEKLGDGWNEVFEAFDGTDEQMNDLISSVIAFQTAMEAVSDPLGTFTEYMEQLEAGPMGALDRMAVGIEDLLDGFDGSAYEADRMTASLLEFGAAVQQFLADIEVARRDIDEGAEQLRRSLTLQTLDDPQKYEFFDTELQRILELIEKSNDPARINDLAQQAYSIIDEAFSLLSPEEQRRLLDEYVGEGGSIDRIEQAANERLGTLQEQIVTQAETIGAKVQEAIINAYTNTIIPQMQATAATNQAAAETMQAAAETPVQVVVTDQSGQVYTVGAGGP